MGFSACFTYGSERYDNEYKKSKPKFKNEVCEKKIQAKKKPEVIALNEVITKILEYDSVKSGEMALKITINNGVAEMEVCRVGEKAEPQCEKQSYDFEAEINFKSLETKIIKMEADLVIYENFVPASLIGAVCNYVEEKTSNGRGPTDNYIKQQYYKCLRNLGAAIKGTSEVKEDEEWTSGLDAIMSAQASLNILKYWEEFIEVSLEIMKANEITIAFDCGTSSERKQAERLVRLFKTKGVSFIFIDN